VDFSKNLLKTQTPCSSGLCQCPDSTVIKISTSVKNHFLNSLFEAFFSQKFSHLFCCFHIPWMAQIPSKLRTQRRDTNQSPPCRIHNGLDVDMFRASEDVEAWPLRCSRYPASYPLSSLLSSRFLSVFQWFNSLGSSNSSMFNSEIARLILNVRLGFDSFLNLNLHLRVSTPLSFQPSSESALQNSVSPSLYKAQVVWWNEVWRQPFPPVVYQSP